MAWSSGMLQPSEDAKSAATQPPGASLTPKTFSPLGRGCLNQAALEDETSSFFKHF